LQLFFCLPPVFFSHLPPQGCRRLLFQQALLYTNAVPINPALLFPLLPPSVFPPSFAGREALFPPSTRQRSFLFEFSEVWFYCTSTPCLFPFLPPSVFPQDLADLATAPPVVPPPRPPIRNFFQTSIFFSPRTHLLRTTSLLPMTQVKSPASLLDSVHPDCPFFSFRAYLTYRRLSGFFFLRCSENAQIAVSFKNHLLSDPPPNSY